MFLYFCFLILFVSMAHHWVPAGHPRHSGAPRSGGPWVATPFCFSFGICWDSHSGILTHTNVRFGLLSRIFLICCLCCCFWCFLNSWFLFFILCYILWFCFCSFVSWFLCLFLFFVVGLFVLVWLFFLFCCLFVVVCFCFFLICCLCCCFWCFLFLNIVF